MTYPAPGQPGPFGAQEGVPGHPPYNGPTWEAQGQQPQFQPQQPYPQQPYPQQQVPYPQQQVPGQAPGQGYAAPFQQPYQGQPAGPVQSPFAAVPARDYVVDAAALLLLLISLFLPWRISPSMGSSTMAASRIDVLLISILSILSLGLSYVWRSGAFGPGWNYRKMQNLRLLANAPYLVMVLVYFAIELVSSRALGSAIAFGLAGAVLAATPRKAELGDAAIDAQRDSRWLFALPGLAGFAALCALIQTIKLLVFNLGNPLGALFFVPLVLLGLAVPAFLVVVALKVAQKSQTWRLVAMGVGFSGLFLGFIAMEPSSRVNAGFYGDSPAFTVIFWMAFGAVAIAPSVARVVDKPAPLEKWQSLSATVMLIMAGTAGLFAVVSLINVIRVLTSSGDFLRYRGGSPLVWILAIVFSAVAVAGYFVVTAAQKGRTRQGRQLATFLAVVLFVLFLVVVIVGSVTPTWNLAPLAIIMAFVLPAAIAGILWIPASMRAHYASMAPGSGPSGFNFDGGAPAGAYPSPGYPGQFGTAAQAGSAAPAWQASGLGGEQGGPGQSGPEQAAEAAALVEAANPATPPERLYELAVAFPNTHKAMAQNPAVYPGLRDWLAEQAKTGQASVPEAAAEPSQAAVPVQSVQPSESSAAIDAVPTAGSVPSQDVLEEAANPATPALRLQELAMNYPQTHDALAANPSTYQGLRDWLEQQHPQADAGSRAQYQPAEHQPAEPKLVEPHLVEPKPVEPQETAESAPQVAARVEDALLAEAANPATSPARLHALAAGYPQVHAAIASNPAAYPQLLEWLAGVGSPGVAEALRQR